MPRIFISYSRENVDIARRLASDLDHLGGDTWIDLDDIHPADDWADAIHQALNNCQIMIVIISPESMQSKNVSREWKYFDSRNKLILPVYWKPADIHFQLANLQYIDFHTQDYDAAFTQLCAELQRQGIVLQPPSAPAVRVEIPAQPALSPRHSRVLDLLPPPFEWIEIPAGKVTLIPNEEDKKESYLKRDTTFDVPAFLIAKRPLTNAQYAKFMKAEGYREQKWWTVAGWQQRGKYGWIEPHDWKDKKLNRTDYSVMSVSWYEAVAFCRWLSEESGELVTLPTEHQWQRVAPIRQYLDGASSFGVMGMVEGNAREWCLTAYETGSTELEGEARRVLWGWSWDNDQGIARAVSRNGGDPRLRLVGVGFRVVCPSSQ